MSRLYIDKIYASAEIPKPATDHAACMDIKACLEDYPNGIDLYPLERRMIPTGLMMCCDPGFRIAMYPRSGLASKLGLTLINCTGVIDADYRGQVMIPVVNLSNDPVTIKHGERIAQIALERLEPTEIVHGLPDTTSNRSGGFGSTGK